MNIFYLDYDQSICARYHVDKHVVKMILEYSQLLSTAHRVLDGVETAGVSASGRKKKVWKLNNSYEDILYAATHINHPSAIWARHGFENYQWLHSLLVELCKEYTYRYGKIHKCERIGLVDKLQYAPFNISTKLFTEPTPAMPVEYVVPGDSLQSYRNYYAKSKINLHNWKQVNPPPFIREINLKIN
jgi:hypothetical protein